ncbi:MAG TPA: hypothetical protein VGS41_13255 [Chthonomonadales bacterium]|nr:hypothetical protein [Chthonomonadales bacterium]
MPIIPPARLRRLVGFALVVSLAGCSSSGSITPAQQNAQRQAALQKQLQAIDDNTHMPPEVKAAAKQSILAHQSVDMSARK